jgi:chromosome segregation ATPase
VCSVTEHKPHECQEIDKFASECIRQIDADLQPIARLIGDIRKRAKTLEKENERFCSDIVAVEQRIEKKGEELKRLIDNHVTTLKAEVQSLKKQTCKEIDSHKKLVGTALVALESFSAYCSELKSKGKPCDITRSANDLHSRAVELSKTEVTELHCSTPYVTFRSMNELVPGGQNFIG